MVRSTGEWFTAPARRAGCYAGAADEGVDVVGGGADALVEGDDEPAVVGVGPSTVRLQVLPGPGVTAGDGTVVHVVAQVRDHERHGRQAGRVVRPGCVGLVGLGRDGVEIGEGVVFGGVAPAG